MSKKSFWLLGFLMFALAFGGFSQVKAQWDELEIIPYDNDQDGNSEPRGVPLSRVLAIGEADDSSWLGTAQVLKEFDFGPTGPGFDASISNIPDDEAADLNAGDIALHVANVLTAGVFDFIAGDTDDNGTDDAIVTTLVTEAMFTDNPWYIGRQWLITALDSGTDAALVLLRGTTLEFYELDDDDDWFSITSGSLLSGDNDLVARVGTRGTSGDRADQLRSNGDGDVEFLFNFPLDVFVNDPANIVPAWRGPTPYVSALRFDEGDATGTDDGIAMGVAPFEVQVPGANYTTFEKVTIDDSDEVFTDGDTLVFDIELRDASGNEIANTAVLIDVANMGSALRPLSSTADDAFSTTGNYLPVWNGPADSATTYTAGVPDSDIEMDEQVYDNRLAINQGRMTFDSDDGDIEIEYTLAGPGVNVNSPGTKQVSVRVIAYPGSLDWNNIGPVYDAQGYDSTGGSPGFRGIIFAEWSTIAAFFDPEDPYDDLETLHLVMDNDAPSADYTMVNPYATPNYMPDPTPPASAPGTVLDYIYGDDDEVRVFIQLDPDDANVNEFHEANGPEWLLPPTENQDPYALFPDDDPNDWDPSGVKDFYMDNITVYINFEALLDPAYLAANPTDVIPFGGDGVPDVAQRLATPLSSNNFDDDYDGEDDNAEDDEDDTGNGFNERFMYEGRFTINENFRGVSTRPATTGPLPIRFVVIDSNSNIKHISCWQENFDETTGMWEPADYSDWRGDAFTDGGGGQAAGSDAINPVLYDDDDGIFPDWGSEAYVPDPALFPDWPGNDSGNTIVTNWDQPFRVIIDSACINSSVVTKLEMGLYTEDPYVIAGAAVIPAGTKSTPTTILGTPVDVLNVGDHIYEITGGPQDMSNPADDLFDRVNLARLTAEFPSDNDAFVGVVQYSADGINFETVKGNFLGDVVLPLPGIP
ncbi:hypothetical protein ACFL6S_00235, partial [Candidatus Poribacteria bacterium]